MTEQSGQGTNQYGSNQNDPKPTGYGLPPLFTKYFLWMTTLWMVISAPTIQGATYWVSPTGEAEWGQASSETPLNGIHCSSLAYANSNLLPGDTVILREGTYNFHILPLRSGTREAPINYAAHENEVPVISNGTKTYATYFHGLALPGKSWISIKGIHFVRNESATYHKTRLMEITGGSSYNEISNCVFDGKSEFCVVRIWDGKSLPNPSGDPCIHNWIHDSTFKNIGELIVKNSDVDDVGGFYIGVPTYDNHSNYNTIEKCTFYGGGHHNLETYTKFNVIRSNFFHHEGSMPNNTGLDARFGPDENGMYGNRNIQIYDGHDSDGMFNLIEANRFGTSGPPPDDEGGDGLTITAPKNIIRYNYVFNALNNTVYFKYGGFSYPHHNRFYNNTLYKSGRYQNSNNITPGAYWQGALVRFHPNVVIRDTKLKNNIFYQFGGQDEIKISETNIAGTGTELINNWHTSQGNPGFVSTPITDVKSMAEPNLNLVAGSPAIDLGSALTTSLNRGANDLVLEVEDALYFQDGTWGSELAGHKADEIAIGTVDNRVRIASIDYNNHQITLSRPITWRKGDAIWISSISDGSRVLYGAGPDLGAFETGENAAELLPPSNLRVEP